MLEGELRSGVAFNARERDEVRCILATHVPGCQVWAFGSRVTGRAKPFSDLDLGVEAPNELTLAEQATLAEAFAESDLPFRVDVVDLRSVDPAFAEQVRRTGLLLGEPDR